MENFDLRRLPASVLLFDECEALTKVTRTRRDDKGIDQGSPHRRLTLQSSQYCPDGLSCRGDRAGEVDFTDSPLRHLLRLSGDVGLPLPRGQCALAQRQRSGIAGLDQDAGPV